MQHLYEVFTRCGALFDGLVSTSYRMVFYTAMSCGKNQLDPFHDGDGEHDICSGDDNNEKLVMFCSDDDDGANGARHVEGLVKINLALFKFSPALD